MLQDDEEEEGGEDEDEADLPEEMREELCLLQPYILYAQARLAPYRARITWHELMLGNARWPPSLMQSHILGMLVCWS